MDPLLQALVSNEHAIVATTGSLATTTTTTTTTTVAAAAAAAAASVATAITERRHGFPGNRTHRFVVDVASFRQFQVLQYGPSIEGVPTAVMNGVFHELQGQWTKVIRRRNRKKTKTNTMTSMLILAQER